VLAQKLRRSGFSVELDLSGSGFKKQFTRADRSALALILDEEAENQTVKLKWMASKEQQAIAQAELLKMTDELRQQHAFLAVLAESRFEQDQLNLAVMKENTFAKKARVSTMLTAAVEGGGCER